MGFFKVNGMYINLDNVTRFFIQEESINDWKAYVKMCEGEDIQLFTSFSEKIAKINLDVMMKYIKEGKEEY